MASDYARAKVFAKRVTDQTLHACEIFRQCFNTAMAAGEFDADVAEADQEEARMTVIAQALGWLVHEVAAGLMNEDDDGSHDIRSRAVHNGAGFVAAVARSAILHMPTPEIQTYTVALLRKALDGEDGRK